ncbi:MAG: zinc ribbon domain-containing protein [Syntrophobacteraceae bacterium]|nr:zinc ribbon domain-containing protein [Syntrophobacteraceae bacterium]
MPIYEFRCGNCGKVEEFILSGSREIEMKCGSCGSEEMERIISKSNYAMGSSGTSASAGPSATTRTCGPGQSCTSIALPGHTR